MAVSCSWKNTESNTLKNSVKHNGVEIFNQIKYYQLSWVNRAALNYQGSRN